MPALANFKNPTETEPHRGIRFLGCRIKPKRHRFGISVVASKVTDYLTTSEKPA